MRCQIVEGPFSGNWTFCKEASYASAACYVITGVLAIALADVAVDVAGIAV